MGSFGSPFLCSPTGHRARVFDGSIPDIEWEQQHPFLQTQAFLGVVTVLAALMMAFPWYGHLVYPKGQSQGVIVSSEQVETATFQVAGMTCASCEAHVKHGVGELDGIVDMSVDSVTGTLWFVLIADEQTRI